MSAALAAAAHMGQAATYIGVGVCIASAVAFVALSLLTAGPSRGTSLHRLGRGR